MRVCVYACVYVYVCVCLWVYVIVCVCVHVVCVCVYAYVCVCLYVCVCECVRMLFVCVCVQMQQYRLFKALSMSYAFFFVAKEIRQQLDAFRKGLDAAGDVSALPEIHATAAGVCAAVCACV